MKDESWVIILEKVDDGESILCDCYNVKTGKELKNIWIPISEIVDDDFVKISFINKYMKKHKKPIRKKLSDWGISCINDTTELAYLCDCFSYSTGEEFYNIWVPISVTINEEYIQDWFMAKNKINYENGYYTRNNSDDY